jgi:Secretion system C-terminal sorting domain
MHYMIPFRYNLFLLVVLSVLAFSNEDSLAQSASIRPVPPPAVISATAIPTPLIAKPSHEQPLLIIPYNCGNPTNEEQYQLELINRARANPDSEGIRLEFDTTAQVVFDYGYFPTQGVYAPTPQQVAADFATYPVRPPLAFNAILCKAARGHDTVMLKIDSQYHYLDNNDSLLYPSDGGYLGPQGRIENAGYINWSNWGENIYDYGNGMDDILAAFLVDWENTDLGHRHNIMNFASTDAIYNEVGIAILDSSRPSGVGPILITEDFGRRMIDPQFTAPYTYVLGVVYTDSNKNGLYDIGEGDSGVTITLSSGTSYNAVTTGSGGYAIPYDIGTRSITITATGGPFGKSSSSQIVQLDSVNVKVDFIAPLSPASVGEPTPIENTTFISPNPASSESNIHFTLLVDEDVSLNIFNTLGENVQSLALGHLSSGSFDYALDLSKLPTGSYTYQLHAGVQIETGRIVVLR